MCFGFFVIAFFAADDWLHKVLVQRKEDTIEMRENQSEPKIFE